MLTWGEAVEVHALRERGWSIAAIARHLGRDPKTIRAYVNGERVPGARRRSAPDPLAPFVDYLVARFADDPHIWASALYDEVGRLGYGLSYVSFARQLRAHKLRPHCQACSGVRGRATIEIQHPPGAELQWDWFERRRAPWGGTGYVLLGSLPYSGRIRGVLAEATDQSHLVEAIDGVLRRFGGTARTWRTDRLATVVVPGTRDIQPSFVPVAKHYGVTVEPCPSRRANRKGSVEAAVRFVCGRWWRTMTATTIAQAQGSLDRFLATIGDARPRPWPDGDKAGRATVGALADAEPLLALPAAPYPATVEVTRPVADDATVAFRGNRYSVPPGLAGTQVTVRHRLGTATLELYAPSGTALARHRLAVAGAGQLVRTPAHRAALEGVVLGAFSTAQPCQRKANRPPGPAALAEAARLLGPAGREVTVDLGRYAELVGGRPDDIAVRLTDGERADLQGGGR
jgi:Mu transposase, C-terminal domain